MQDDHVNDTVLYLIMLAASRKTVRHRRSVRVASAARAI